MVAINIRGTSGSGKSTLVRRVMDLYPKTEKTYQEKRRQPICVKLTRWGEQTGLYVPGHYETACGGCDTVKTVDQVYEMVRGALDHGWHVLYEGIMVMDDVNRAVTLARDHELVVIGLTTPVEECLAAVRQRRLDRGDDRPLSEKNTRDRAVRCERGLVRLRSAGVQVEMHDRQGAFERVRELLGVGA